MTTATTGVHPLLEPLRIPACEGKAGYHDFAPRTVAQGSGDGRTHPVSAAASLERRAA